MKRTQRGRIRKANKLISEKMKEKERNAEKC